MKHALTVDVEDWYHVENLRRVVPPDTWPTMEARLERKSLVRFWGQRNTLHLYAARDWPFLHTVFGQRQ